MARKKWSALSDSYKQRLRAKGVTPQQHNAVFRRKPWDELSEGYRKRLERQGVSPRAHASGSDIFAARGKRSREYQAEQRFIFGWYSDFAQLYGRNVEDMMGDLAEFGRDEILSAMRLQEQMADLYQLGFQSDARRLWETRDRSLPDWLFYYHSYFS